MSEWKIYKLGEIYDFASGLSKGKEFFGKGYDFVTFKDIFQNYFLPERLTALVESNQKERDSCSVLKGDVFLTRTSENDSELGLSSVALKDYPNATFNGFTKRLRPKGNVEIVPEYAGFYFRSSKFRTRLSQFATMTTRASLNNEILNNLTIDLPEKSIQIQIGNILKSLDDKIELNLQMNQTLEAMAQAIFKEWFVNFNFPKCLNCDSGDLCDEDDLDSNKSRQSINHKNQGSDNGLPKGWRMGKISEICRVNANTLSAKDEIKEIHYIEISEVGKGVIKNITTYKRGEEPSRAKRKLSHGDVVLSTVRPNRGSYFLAIFPNSNLIASTGFAVFTSTLVPFSFLYCFLTNEEQIEYYGKMADGAAYPAINQAVIMNIDLVIPSTEDLKLFNDVAENLYLKIYENFEQNKSLTQIRDSLLPKLMTGKIKIQA